MARAVQPAVEADHGPSLGRAVDPGGQGKPRDLNSGVLGLHAALYTMPAE